MHPELSGKVAVVTGAGTGIGRAAAAALHEAGARVALLGRRQAPLEACAAALSERGEGRALALPADVTDREGLARAIDSVLSRWERIDILVNNAGTNIPRRSLAETSPADWDEVVAVNLTGAFNAVQAVLPALRRQGSGHIINIGSTSALRASKLGGAAYCAAKHGIVALNDIINQEGKEYGVRGTAIHPGEVDTPILDKRPQPVSEERRRAILRPEDIARAVLFAAASPPRVVVSEIVVKPLGQDW
jgi:NADP-dependent 3-hydroxy acid dehydrogenase YdfG